MSATELSQDPRKQIVQVIGDTARKFLGITPGDDDDSIVETVPVDQNTWLAWVTCSDRVYHLRSEEGRIRNEGFTLTT